MYKLGLALSGGGVKGAVHAGVLKCLEEHKITPNIVSGTSAGAIVGALYASGIKGDEILNFFLNERPYSTSMWAGKSGLLATSQIREVFEKYISHDSFQALETQLITCATNMLSGKVEYFEKGSLIDAALASASFPGVFSPMEIGDQLYSDGGLLNHFPADVLAGDCKVLIGVHLSPNKPLTKNDLASTRSILSRAIDIQGSAMEVEKLELCDISIFPEELIQYSTFDFDKEKMHEMFEIGYAYMASNMDKLKTLLNSSCDTN